MIPNDLDILYRLSGCTASREFFVRNSDVVVDAFRVSECGKWLVSDRAQQIGELLHNSQPTETKQCRKRSSFLLDSTLSVPIYDIYPRKEGRKKALEEIQKAIKRLSYDKEYTELRSEHGIPAGEEAAAAAYLYERTKIFADSPAGQRDDRQFIPHPATWFHQDRFADDELNWTTRSTDGRDNRPPKVSAAEERRQRIAATTASALGFDTGRVPAYDAGNDRVRGKDLGDSPVFLPPERH